MKKISRMDFIKKIEKGTYDIQLRVDNNIFEEEIVLKAAYELVDKVYMFFKKDGEEILIEFKLKDKEGNLEEIVNYFGEELVYHRLRKQIDEKTGDMRKKILETALGFGLNLNELRGDVEEVMEKVKEIKDFGGMEVGGNDNTPSKSVDQIIEEIENDPDFEDDKDEIKNILKEIEEEENVNEEDAEEKEKCSGCGEGKSDSC